MTALLALLATAFAADPVLWVDWTGRPAADQVIGTITTPSGQIIDVSYQGEVAFVQTSGGTNFWNPSGGFISATVPNPPPTPDIIALSRATSKVLTFSEPIANPLFAVVSLNGNGYRFDRDFTILSYGPGYWGNGTLTRRVAVNPDGSLAYELVGTGEPHGVIQFVGTFSTVSWTSLTNEYWNGFSIAVQGTAADLPGEISMYDVNGDLLTDEQVTPIDLGDVLPGGVGQVDLTITNDGPGPLDLSGVTIDGPDATLFAAGPLPPALAAGTSVVLTVTFAPAAVGTSDAALHLTTSDGDESPFDLPLVGRSLDADGDDVADVDDRCPGGDDREDLDSDGTPDACDRCPFDPADDSDDDGLCDGDDACPYDVDNDIDRDGVCMPDDNCPTETNDQADVDRDGIGDVCDVFLAIEGSCPGPITISATGLTPGGPLAVVASATPGAIVVPSGPCAGAVSGLGGQPRLLARPRANLEGDLFLNVTAPSAACGQLLQVLDLQSCTFTNVAHL